MGAPVTEPVAVITTLPATEPVTVITTVVEPRCVPIVYEACGISLSGGQPASARVRCDTDDDCPGDNNHCEGAFNAAAKARTCTRAGPTQLCSAACKRASATYPGCNI